MTIQRWHERRWMIVSVLSLLLGIYLAIAEAVPLGREVWHLTTEHQAVQQRLQTAARWEDEVAQLSREQESLQRAFAARYVRVAGRAQMADVLHALHEVAAEAGVVLTQLRPGDKSVHDAYEELPLHIQVEGHFHGIGAFVDAIEQADHLIQVQAFDIASAMQDPTRVKADLQLKLTLLKDHSTRNERR